MIPGLDCGSPQGKISPATWQDIFSKGHTWAFYRCMSGIGPGLDPTFADNLANGRAAGLKVGAYFVFIPGTDPQDDPITQANAWFSGCGALGTAAGELPPVIDFEIASKQQTPEQEIASLCSCIVTMTQAWGRAPIIYGYPDMWKRYEAAATPEQLAIIATCLLWYAAYQSNPPSPPAPWTVVTFWQKSGGTGYQVQAGDPCDEDYFLGDEAALDALASYVESIGPNLLAGAPFPLDIPGGNT
jgi:hypothetical protein